MHKNVKTITVFLLLGFTLALSSILGREYCKYQENPNKELDFFNEVNPFLEVSAPSMIQSLVFGAYQGNIGNLDPHYAWDAASIDVIDQVVEQLYQFNISDPDLPIIPWLALDFPTISPNGTEYTITLKQGIKFHDNTTMNATAVKWSFDRLCYFMNYSGNADLPAPFNIPLPDSILRTQFAYLYEQADGKRVINKTEVLSTYQVKITLNELKASFMSLLCFSGSGILSDETGSTPPLDYYQLSDTLIGTGPFNYTGFIADVEVSFEGFADYWGTPDNTGPPQLETLIYSIVPDYTTLRNGLLAGTIDIIDRMASSDIPVLQADPDISCEEYGNTLQVAWITFNYDHIPLAMRRGLSWCFDYSYSIEVISGGQALRWPTYIPFGIPYANYSLDYPTYNLTKAREILLTDGYYGPILAGAGITAASPDSAWTALADGATPLASLNYTYNIPNTVREDNGYRLAYDARYIGVDIDVFGEAWGDFINMIQFERDYMDMYIMAWRPDYLDPENYINPLYSNTSTLNGGNFYEPDVQALMDDGLTETNPVAREAIYQEIQRLMVEEYLPAMTLTSGINYDAWQTYVHGWVPNPIDRTWFYPVYLADLTPPVITIHSPVSDQVFGIDAPDFSITVSDQSPINFTWYTIDGGTTNFTFSGLTGTVNQTAWDNKGTESMTLRFYANDSLGLLGFEDVIIWKDLVAPKITINSPTPNQMCGVDAPTFSLTIIEPNIQIKRYSLNGRPNITFTTETQFSQTEWDNIGNGTVSIIFYVIDGAGNVNSSQIIARKDAVIPDITIDNPIADEIFGNTSPDFTIEIIEENLDSTWYTVEGSITQYPFTGLTGTINQDAWDDAPEGDVTIIFYAIDGAGNVNSSQVIVRKDTIIPDITIISPILDDVFTDPPGFFISIIEEDLVSTWYTVEGSITQHLLTRLTGTIDEDAWDDAPEGDVTITFYAEDRAGNIGSESVVVIKRTRGSEISGYNVIWLFGAISVISIILMKKIKNK